MRKKSELEEKHKRLVWEREQMELQRIKFEQTEEELHNREE